MRRTAIYIFSIIFLSGVLQSAFAARAGVSPTASIVSHFAARGADAVYEGVLIDGAKWQDNNGDNVLIVSGKEIRSKNSATFTQQIFGYHYATKNGRTALLWRIQDSAINRCAENKISVSPISVRDINGDGVAETMFVYNIAGRCDAAEPAAFKLMMHSGAQKLAIRGTNAVKIGSVVKGNEKTFDPAFDRAPLEFKKAASEFWDKHVGD